MFSSTNNNFQTFPSSSSYNPPLVPFYSIDPETDNVFATHASTILDHGTLASVPFMPTTIIQPPIPANLMLSDHYAAAAASGGGVPRSFLIAKKPAAAAGGAKKDRHSKIFTSQGLRDRRVRLSSEIARKFFDLQDMLQYDKPSNTLQWLLAKSDNAIKELSQKKSLASTEMDDGVEVGTKKEPRGRARARAGSKSGRVVKVKDMMMMMMEEEEEEAAAHPQTLHQLMQPPIVDPNSLMHYSQNQNFDEIPKGTSYNNSNYHSCSCPNSPPNWD